MRNAMAIAPSTAGPDTPPLKVVDGAAVPRTELIRIQNVSKTYVTASGDTVHAVDSVDMSIGDGEFVCIVGPSGCGKSTLLRMLAGLDTCDGGTLTLGGVEVTGPSGEVGVVFQAANLLPWITVRENVALPLRVGGRRESAEQRITDLLAVAGLKDFGGRYPYELSGGMQQRAGICRALARDPKILLMDEPFGALDALTRERMNAELQRIWQANAKTVVLITHSISEAIFLADRVVVMSARPGRVLREIEVPIPRPRTFDSIVSHPEYARLAREIRALLNEQESTHE
ncbi:ABC transporter ATP-binding protein [Bordetella bronchialis]|uniref:ABC transporter ATP-binding protein n=1 Tax=Bordetella bronchialis TaxID=463025 RepID=UPI000B0DB1DE|nr:ABC transporter ATP-binding protein [Bordetella bronchialis]